MFVIIEQFTSLLDNALDVIQRKRLAEVIVLRDKNDIGFGQLLVCVSRLSDVGIQQAAVVPCSFLRSTLVSTLHLDVVGCQP